MMVRYQNWCLATHGHDLAEDDKGNWVLLTDYLLLQAALKEALEEWDSWVDRFENDTEKKEYQRIQALRKQFLSE